MEREFIRGSNRAGEKENRAETISNFRLLRTQRMAGTKSCRAIGSECRPSISGATSRRRVTEKGNQSAGEKGDSRSDVISTKDPNVVPVSSPLPLNKGRGLRRGDCYGSRRSRFQPSPSPLPGKERRPMRDIASAGY